MNVICILLDSLNRHMLPCYREQFDLFGLPKAQTPNLCALAERGVIFDRHFIGSSPCMPARREIWTGQQELLWRPWGSLECWDEPHARLLKDAGVCTQLITDHYHLWEHGGENYHCDFEGFEPIRGHEVDPWITAPNPQPPRVAGAGRNVPRYIRNLQRFRREEDYPSPKTFRAAMDWVAANAGKHERFFLMLDEFDPHEPFHCPEPYNSMYDGGEWDDARDGVHYWPEYGQGPRYDERSRRHLRAQYCGKLTMADRWLGRFLDTLADHNLLDDTLIILTTDHGHYLGEHGWWGKPYIPCFNNYANIPLLVAMPGVRPGARSAALTTNVDIYSTILDAFGCAPRGPVDGVSLLPLLRGRTESVRQEVLYGYWGQGLNYTDNRHTYHRPPAAADNTPLAMYSHRWSTAPWWRVPNLDAKAAAGRFMPGRDVQLFRRELSCEEMRQNTAVIEHWQRMGPQLFDLTTDWPQARNLAGSALEREYAAKMKTALEKAGAPREQFQRMGF